MVKILLKAASKGKPNICRNLLQTEKDRIGFAPLKNYLTWQLFNEVSEKTKFV